MGGSIEQDTTRRSVSREDDSLSLRVPALTLLCHSDLQRVGERVRLLDLAAGGPGEAQLSRLAPRFAAPDAVGDVPGEPIGDRSVSRSPIRIRREPDGALAIVASDTDVRVDGTQAAPRVVVPADRLDEGVVIELGSRVVLLVHRLGPPLAATPALGLVGASEAIDQLRRDILRVADLDVPILLRGETGTGKERVANALHQAGPRRDGPMVAVNTAALPPQTAASALFGHVRGAFTGAVDARDGHFREANGGTLFLDEIGEVSMDVQAMLLRALDHNEIQPVGAPRAIRVDVRLVAATDSDLERAIASGRFREALLHRLSGYQLAVPALRERRDDISRLLLHFLRDELAAFGEADRLAATDEPWLRGSIVAALCRHAWPGNVRQLRNVARQIAISSRGHRQAKIDPVVEGMLGDGGAAQAVSNAARDERAPRPDPSEEQIVAALEQHGWRVSAAAAHLGISKTRMYELARRCAGVRTAREIDAGEIRRQIDESGGDLDAAADALRLSRRALLLRMRELGLDPR